MGQKIGKGYVVAEAEPFLSLPQSAVDELWKSFNLNTEGWGLNPAQFIRMCKALQPAMQLDDDVAEETYRGLFQVFDTDKNDLIDALEFLATIAAIISRTVVSTPVPTCSTGPHSRVAASSIQRAMSST